MKDLLQEFLNHVESKPSPTASVEAQKQWFNLYEQQKERMINLFDCLYNEEELDYIKESLSMTIESGKRAKDHINKTMRLQDAVKGIFGDSTVIQALNDGGIMPTADDARESLEEINERVKFMQSVLDKTQSILGIKEIQNLTK